MRFRLLWPLLLVSTLAALLVATLSTIAGRQWAIGDVRERYSGVQATIQQASFPLTSSVVSSLAELSGSELIALNASGDVVASTIVVSDEMLAELRLAESALNLEAEEQEFTRVRFRESQTFLALSFRRYEDRDSTYATSRVFVLFDESRVLAAGRRAGWTPLVTGISTIVLLTTIMTFMTGRLASRLLRLQQGVERVANGNFDTAIVDNSSDEVGRLGQSVNQMATQLKHLWTQVNRQQSQKLIHQIAGGMAHQLRNTLTGARLALELHQQTCQHADQSDLEVALREMEGAEDYVRRILLVGSGDGRDGQPAQVQTCLNDVRSSHAAVAKHLHVDLTWDVMASLENCMVADGASFSAAISNLVLNALQSASHVSVSATRANADLCSVCVADDGPGIDSQIAQQIFEPFVTTKPEGMGLGLPLVRRAAEQLDGQVEWKRQNDRTVFEFRCRIAPMATK